MDDLLGRNEQLCLTITGKGTRKDEAHAGSYGGDGIHKHHLNESSDDVKVEVSEQKWKLLRYESVYYTHNDQVSQKLAIFDLDGTIIETISGQRFAQSDTDWRLTDEQVLPILHKYHDHGYKLMIVTNQYNIDLELLSKKIMNLQKLIQIPIEFYIATEKDTYRKPMTDLWDFILVINHLTPISIHHSSFYCGDAAGREKNYLYGKPRDFNITDRYFAHNIKITFYTPEEIFHDLPPFKYFDSYQTELDLSEYYPTTPWSVPESLSEQNKNLIIMVGPQASGKSTLSTSDNFRDYVHLNSDTIKNINTLKKQFINGINKNQNVIIDNTNPSLETRQYYIQYAKQFEYTICCYFFDFPKILTKHLNQMRAQMTHNRIHAIPMVAIHTYYKNLVTPSISEGFNELITVKKLHTPINQPDSFQKYYYYHYDLK